MLSLSQFFILSPRGDCVLFKDFRGDVTRNTPEIFLRNVKGTSTDAPPVFNIDGINYFFLKKNSLYFCFTNRENTSASFVLELLVRITKVFKDYCGVLTEESVRANFVLLYELIEEMVDFGCVLNTQTDQLKPFVFNEPVLVKSQQLSQSSFKISETNAKTTSASAVDKPIIPSSLASSSASSRKNNKNEVFVDVFERISVTFNSNGACQLSSIEGTIQLKSYLQQSSPPALCLALNEEIVVGKSSAPSASFGAIEIEDCNFHECVRLQDFETSRVLLFSPPQGEFVLMNYRMNGEKFRPPFKINPFFELVSPTKIELVIKIRADLPESCYANGVIVTFPIPKTASSCTNSLGVGVVGQTVEYDEKDRKVTWKIKKFNGATEQTLRTKINLSTAHNSSVRKEIGPISMSFEIPMYNPSGLQIRYLRAQADPTRPSSAAPQLNRWVRYVTRSQSYVARF